MKAIYKIRQYIESDSNFIVPYWSRYYKNNSVFTRSIKSSIYFKEHTRLIDKALKDCMTLVACDIKEPDIIYGFINGYVASTNVLNFVYIKKNFRGMGIGRVLINSLFTDKSKKLVCTHEKPNWEYDYNPYLFFLKGE
jgi:GNAT superfamily N-acetyltransferase